MNVLKELYQSRRLIWKLSKNDFRNKFAGSYFGIIWAFIQPMVTVAVYFVVFQLGLRVNPSATGYPYICWLVAGIIPWFFFSDALPSASNCLLEYSYLVKKVVFKISILPIVKIISSLFVHLFFIVFTLVVFVAMGKLPPIQIIQIPYYMFAVICFVTALSYLTCAITPFFRDFGQIINVCLSVGMWATPILWDKTTIANIPQWLDRILKLNPLYYIVQGYRESFMNGIWFFEHPWMTLYFWAFVLVLVLVSSKVFKRLRVHFSDVL
ncbi:MAG: ABC transporter permease [Fusicatenibacter sp.]|nr:ABC transporter permease [Lachnospiraceae bacterium]MDY2939125.1 ABC transporter permease [Fusicatenibacter sp.]